MMRRFRRLVMLTLGAGLLLLPAPGSDAQTGPSFTGVVIGNTSTAPLDPTVHERHEGRFDGAQIEFEARRGERTIVCRVNTDDGISYRARETAAAGRGFITVGQTARGPGTVVAETETDPPTPVGEAINCEVRLGHLPDHNIEGQFHRVGNVADVALWIQVTATRADTGVVVFNHRVCIRGQLSAVPTSTSTAAIDGTVVGVPDSVPCTVAGRDASDDTLPFSEHG